MERNRLRATLYCGWYFRSFDRYRHVVLHNYGENAVAYFHFSSVLSDLGIPVSCSLSGIRAITDLFARLPAASTKWTQWKPFWIRWVKV
ncbi:hypothetical protein EUGRSUZ_H04788 [Eucalyptus grandis]|uniref:Uncharacterized protein n=2 Tax=Eucalyptus grandis TaxID=71139 RepID=A0ACC3JZN1_EUCGR|nr:hypothetical protein EUGRSUZ_H04788 [Eucalyptus grandis]